MAHRPRGRHEPDPDARCGLTACEETRPRSLTVGGTYGYAPYAIHVELAMPATTATREDRIELRATKEEKRLLATAAAYERLDVTSFIMRSVLPAAREAVDRAERIVLSERDTARVLELLENPPGPLRPCSPPRAAAAPGADPAPWTGARSRSAGSTTAEASIAARPRCAPRASAAARSAPCRGATRRSAASPSPRPCGPAASRTRRTKKVPDTFSPLTPFLPGCKAHCGPTVSRVRSRQQAITRARPAVGPL